MSPLTYRIATIPGDGIGPEVVASTCRVLERLQEVNGGFRLEFQEFDWSSKRYQQLGSYLPEDGLEAVKHHDAILFGAVGSPDVPDHISLWSLILQIRKQLKQNVNVRPITVFPGLSPVSNRYNAKSLDWVIIRENSEGEYAGQGGTSHEGSCDEMATEVAIFTRSAIQKCIRFAFETAAARPRRSLTLVTKSNAQRYGLVLWDKIFYEVSKDFPEVKTDKMLVDAMTVRMVLKPETVDTIVTTNLHGDILSDLAAALAGSIGVAASSNLNLSKELPSMFEPIHGSAPDIAGLGVANPVGTYWSAAEMLRWLGETQAADHLMECIKHVTRSGVKTKDVGGQADTEQVTKEMIRALGGLSYA